MNFGPYMKSGLLKKQQVNFKQISRQIVRAEKDLATVRLVLYVIAAGNELLADNMFRKYTPVERMKIRG